MPNYSDTLKSLRKELKDWEHSFIDIQSRSPTKNDIKANPSIQQKYKEYSKIKKLAAKKRSPRKSVVRSPAARSMVRSPMSAHKNQATCIEIGPTPQIFGRSISIFEMNLSPVKKRLKIPQDDEPIDDTTTKVESESVEIDFGESPFVESSPEADSGEEANAHTEISNIFSSGPAKTRLAPPVTKHYGPNSPLKLPADLSVAHRLLTPRKKKTESVASDSDMLMTPPLWKRSISKPLKELEDEYQEIVRSFVPHDSADVASQSTNTATQTIQSNDKENSAPGTESSDSVLADIQKVRRRKGRIRRFEDSAGTRATTGVQVNLHKQMHRLKKKQLMKILKELNMEDTMEFSEDEEETEDASALAKAKKPARRKKYNLVSNNFRRLKLPSRQRNNFMKRFRRR